MVVSVSVNIRCAPWGDRGGRGCEGLSTYAAAASHPDKERKVPPCSHLGRFVEITEVNIQVLTLAASAGVQTPRLAASAASWQRETR